MSRVEGVFELSLPPDRAQICCRRVFAELGWTMNRDQPGLLEGREDITRLACHQSPAETTLEIAASSGGSEVSIATKVPGLGPIASSHAHGRQKTILLRIHAEASSARGATDQSKWRTAR